MPRAKSAGSGVSSSTLRTSGQIKQEKKARQEKKNSTSSSALSTHSNVFAITGNKGSLSGYKLPDGIVAVDNIIPEQAKAILEAQFKSLGLPIDTSCLVVRAEDRSQFVKQLEETAEMLHRDATLLPRICAAIKKCLRAATKSAQEQAKMVKASLKEQAKIDDAHAEMLLALLGYNRKHNALQMKLERKVREAQALDAAKARMYDTAWGAKKQFIDASTAFSESIIVEQAKTKELVAAKRTEQVIEREQWKQASY